MRLTLDLQTPPVQADLTATARTVTGVAVPYGVPGRTSAGTLTVAAGAIEVPPDLRYLKLFSEHRPGGVPVGYAVALVDDAAGLTLTCRVGATPDGDTALLNASEGVRDALSVELSDVVIDHGVVTAARLDAVALVPLGAFPGTAVLTAADDPVTVSVDVPLPDPDTPPADPVEDENTDDAVDPDDVDPAPTTEPEAPTVTAGLPARPLNGRTTTTARTLTAAQAADRIALAIRGATDAAQVNAALTDIVPAADPAQGFLQDNWIGELWTPAVIDQTITNAVQSAPLTTGTKVHGWRWKDLPTVADYAGAKAAIPSDTVALEPAEASVYRLAGGWDVDRLFVDLSQGDFLGQLLAYAAVDLARKFETKIAAAAIAAAGTLLTAGDVIGAIAAVVSKLASNGAVATTVAVAPDLFGELLGVPATDAPWWLAGSSTVSLANSSGNVSDVKIGASVGLAAGMVLGIDRRGMTHYQNSVQVRAENIPNGGIDVGLFGYGADLVHNVKGFAAANVVTVP